jgi:hypothetical protein
MSLINDALKQARQAPPRNVPSSLPPLQPVPEESSGAVWLIPAIVIFLIVAAIFFIGWAAAHNTVRSIVTNSGPAATQADETATAPVVIPHEAPPPPPPPPPVELPRLQGIFYSATAPTAILDGKTVAPGDQFKDFHVKAISKFTVTLVGPDKKEYTVGMGG